MIVTPSSAVPLHAQTCGTGGSLSVPKTTKHALPNIWRLMVYSKRFYGSVVEYEEDLFGSATGENAWLWHQKHYTSKIDVFSLACTLVETFCSKARSTPCKREMPLRSPATAKTPAARICRKRLDVATVLLCGGVSVALKHERLVLLVV